MGSKVAARERMQAAGVPIIPGTTEPVSTAEEVRALGDELGWPIAIKAPRRRRREGPQGRSLGGGGRARLRVRPPRGGGVLLRPGGLCRAYLEDPRHVEVQVLADAHGAVVHLGERDCTIQRRHQKLVEETPSPAVSEDLRERIGQIAVDAARAVGYRSAGTIEGLLSQEGEYFFLEMNTRIQVEHTVTELVTGLDLIREQVLIAAGEPLWLRQEDVRLSGHAIECRINAEDPSNGFLPAPGRITGYSEPGPGAGGFGVEAGSEVVGSTTRWWRSSASTESTGSTRDAGCFARSTSTGSRGCRCSASTRRCSSIRAFSTVRRATASWSPRSLPGARRFSHRATTVSATSDGAATRERVVNAELDGRRYELKLHLPEPPHAELARRRRERVAAGAHHGAARDAVVSPMQGTVLAVEVADGDDVQPGQVLCVVEAMKMENEITAHRAGRVTELSVEAGQAVKTGQVICVLQSE